jgi:hypothetical protein
MREIERAEWPLRQAFSPRQRTQPFEYASDRCRRSQGQIDRVEAQTLGIAREEQYSDADLGSGCSDHAWKLMEKGPRRARIPGVDPLKADSTSANRAESDALQRLGGGRTLVRNQGA